MADRDACGDRHPDRGGRQSRPPCDRQLDPDEVLLGWYDDWVIFERERLRQRVLHGLEALSTLLLAEGRCAEAVEAALRAVHLEPLRESGQRAPLLAHLAEGNQVEARPRA